MSPAVHMLTTLPIAAAAWTQGGWPGAAAALAGGVLIDVDHLADYWLDEGLRFKPAGMFAYYGAKREATLVVPFHSVELLALIAWLLPPQAGLPFAAAATLHLALDNTAMILWGRYKPWSAMLYLLAFRLALGFDKAAIDRLIRHPGQGAGP